MTTKFSLLEKYKACYDYVIAVDNLPPTYDISSNAGTNPIPDPTFINNVLLDHLLNEYDKAKIHMDNVLKQ